MAAPFSRTSWMNVLIYHLLISVVNLLHLPREKGTFVPRRSARLTVYTKHLDHLRLLKSKFEGATEAELQAYLIAVKEMLFEIQFLLEQEDGLKRNPDFAEDFRRLMNLVHNLGSVEDFKEAADLAYKLSVLLPFYEDDATLEMRRAQAAEFNRMKGRSD
ncbi:MAG TPA: hypothetical protein VNZ52_12880 [Candidatus Thermoplasmatota archaeon]|nr:hypothetical protein [Candidatus Thermoplasmatota archaeon]